MKLVKGPEAERVTGGLWRQFLISESYITVVIDTKAQLQMNISGLSF